LLRRGFVGRAEDGAGEPPTGMEHPPDKTTEDAPSAKAPAGPGHSGWDAEIERLEIVDSGRVRIWRDEFRRLCVRVDPPPPKAAAGEGPPLPEAAEAVEFVDVRPAQVFPVSEAADYIAFLNTDDKEVLMLQDRRGLEADSLRCLEEELGRVYFVPKVTVIYAIEDAHGAARWEVETDRGYRVFDVRDREDVRVLEGSRVLLQDADGNRYEIADIGELDERSRRLLDGEI